MSIFPDVFDETSLLVRVFIDGLMRTFKWKILVNKTRRGDGSIKLLLR